MTEKGCSNIAALGQQPGKTPAGLSKQEEHAKSSLMVKDQLEFIENGSF